MIRRGYDNWRKRLKLINLSKGCHIENVKDIYSRLIKLKFKNKNAQKHRSRVVYIM
jgi:hypothetical protein